jgi:hypothetical protein
MSGDTDSIYYEIRKEVKNITPIAHLVWKSLQFI